MTVVTVMRDETAAAATRWTLPQARDFETVNALIAAPLFERDSWTWRAWWIGFVISLALTAAFLVAVFLVLTADRHLGRQHHGGLGFCHCRLRVVDRYRQRRHPDLGDAAIDAAEVARLDQSLCRGDDAVRCDNRRHFPDHPPRPAALFLLAHALSQYDDGVAAMAQRADLGFLGDPELHPVLDPVLVCRSHP